MRNQTNEAIFFSIDVCQGGSDEVVQWEVWCLPLYNVYIYMILHGPLWLNIILQSWTIMAVSWWFTSHQMTVVWITEAFSPVKFGTRKLASSDVNELPGFLEYPLGSTPPPSNSYQDHYMFNRESPIHLYICHWHPGYWVCHPKYPLSRKSLDELGTFVATGAT